MSAALVKPPTRGELEALSLAERVALEDVLGEAQQIVRELNDAEIARLHEAGASQRAIAEAMGVSKTTARNRLFRLGLVVTPDHPIPQNGDGPVVDAEVVDDPLPSRPQARREVVREGPAHHLPDVMAEDALENLRTQALHWFEQGLVVRELLDRKRPLEPRSDEDRKALHREASTMERIARRLIKEAASG